MARSGIRSRAGAIQLGCSSKTCHLPLCHSSGAITLTLHKGDTAAKRQDYVPMRLWSVTAALN
jgi:hypothetical protein